MTRKKSNVKALALAVTCAILAGGGIGLEPVYAADALYKDKTTGNVTITSSTSATEITGITVGGVTLQDKGITAADGNFTVDGDDGKIVVTGGNGTVTIDPSGEGIVYERKDAGQRIQLDSGYVKASGYVEAPKFSIDGDNFFKKEGNESQLLVSDTKGRVNIGSGTITATGDVNVGGNLWVGGTSRFIDGIETDTIDEATTGAGVTVDGVLLKDKGISAAGGKFTVNGATGNVTTAGAIQGADITATGALKGKTLGIGGVANDQFTVDENGAVKAAGGKFTVDADGNTTVGGTLGVTGATTLGSTLDVTGKTTLKDELQVDKKATFGSAAGSQTIINGGDITADGQLNAKSARIGGVNGIGISDSGVITGVTKLTTKALEVTDNLVVGGDITGAALKGTSLAIAGNGTIGGSLGVTGAITGATINGATITTESFNGAKISNNKFNGVTLDTNGDISGKDITATGKINGATITDNSFNGVTLSNGNVTGGTITGTTVTDGAGASMSGGKVIAPNGVEVDANNYLNSSGLQTSNIVASEATIGKIKLEGSKITSTEADGTVGIAGITVNNAGALNNVRFIDGVAVGAVAGGNGLQFGGNAVVGATNKPFSSTGYEVDGEGNVKGKSFKVNGSNYLDSTGLTTEKAVIGGVNTLNDKGIDTSKNLHVGGQATFGDSTGTHTTINGGTITSTNGTDTTTIGPNKITTKTLDVEDIILRNEMKDGTGATINIKGSDGSMSVAKGKFKVDDKGQVTNHITATGAAAADTIFTTSEIGIDATFQKTGETASSGLKIDYNHAALNASGGAALDLKDKTATLGIGTDSLTTYTSDTIKSKVGSTTVTTKSGGTTFGDGTANNTLINGSSITSTKDGTFTTINGSSVRSYNSATGAGHLNGATLNLWKDSDNATYMTAGGATFTKDGKTTTISGDTITTGTLNVKDIVLGGTMYDATGHPLDGKLSIGNDGHLRAANGNFDVKDDGTFKNTVGNTTLQTDTTGASMKFNNTATTGGIKSEVAVADDSAKISAGASSIEVKNDGITNNGVTTFNGTTGTTTKIDGGTITTNHLITDKLTITGSGNAEGLDPSDPDYRGSIAFGGNGSITSNIKDGTKEVTFKTDKTGTFTEAKDGSNVTTNTVNAQGNTNVVTDGTNTSTATQTATSIGGVVTNGTVKMSQELTADGVKFEQTGYDEVNIAKGDVTVKNNRNTATPNQEVHLSDLGSLNNLDGELAARDEYTDNKTAVGAINAEAGIRREEVTRLDGRINDVNDRVNKVGAMAAAIASLKSIATIRRLRASSASASANTKAKPAWQWASSTIRTRTS